MNAKGSIIEACKAQLVYDRDYNVAADCAGFVRSVGARVGVSIDGPPRPGNAGPLVLLAELQGWTPLKPEDAQAYANFGNFVIAGYVNIPQQTSHVSVITSGQPVNIENRLLPFGYWEMQGAPIFFSQPNVQGTCYGTINWSFYKYMLPNIKYLKCPFPASFTTAMKTSLSTPQQM